MKRFIPIVLLGLIPFSLPAAGTLEQRLEKVERQMSRLTVLMMEMQDLRADLQQNYGAVEEMVHKLEQLKKEQNSNYLDLEQRLKKLEAGNKSRPEKAGSPTTDRNSNQERESYNSAFALVRENRSKKALKAFNNFIKKFPKGEYAGDAWYWIGRLHDVGGKKKEAGKAFAQARTILDDVVKKFPGTPQAERAALKLEKIKK